MLFGRKSEATGMSSHPSVRCVPPLLELRWSLNRRSIRSIHDLTITFWAVPNIPYIAGGSYGDEFRPN